MNHVVISHVDKHPELAFHRDLLQTGVYVENDSHFRWKTEGENRTLALLQKMLPEFSNQNVLGMDMAKNTYWKSYGGKPGLIYLLTDFKKKMQVNGLLEYFETMFLPIQNGCILSGNDIIVPEFPNLKKKQ